MNDRLHAVEILDWDYLCKVGERVEPIRNINDAVKSFAYNFTGTESVELQDRMLSDWLVNATYNQSAESSEEVVAVLAYHLQSDRNMLRAFARQAGVRLKRDVTN